MKSTIRWIVFDLGGVVINVNFKNFFSALPLEYHAVVDGHQETLTRLFQAYELRSGEQLPGQVYDQIRGLINAPITNKQLEIAINAMLGDPIQEVCHAIELLSKNYSIACLSNTNHIHWDYLLGNYPIMKTFQVQIASHLVGASKPDSKIYKIAQELLQAQAAELLFFDDKLENVEAACELGWKGVVFKGYESLRDGCESNAIYSLN